jgi:hypothetical protein
MTTAQTSHDSLFAALTQLITEYCLTLIHRLTYICTANEEIEKEVRKRLKTERERKGTEKKDKMDSGSRKMSINMKNYSKGKGKKERKKKEGENYVIFI